MPIWGLFSLARFNFAARARVASASRTILRTAGLVAGRTGLGVRAAEIVEEAAELQQRAIDIVEAAYYEAMDTMFNMVGNAGQETVFNEYVIPSFAEALAQSEIEYGWDDVDIGEYMAFMGEIVSEGNAIMSQAFDEASSLIDEASDAEASIDEEMFDEETGQLLENL